MECITFKYEKIPPQILHEYENIEKESIEWKNWHQLSETDLWDNLFLCILSSNIIFELAKSAFSHLLKRGYLELEWIYNDHESSNKITRELQQPRYLPLKKDGTLRKFRFPKCRANNIVSTVRNFYKHNTKLTEILAEDRNEIELRNYLVKNVSGFGLKQATHYLRNIGYSENLAIIDTHILSFLRKYSDLNISTTTITDKKYLEYEQAFLIICKNLNLKVSLFDAVIWKYMRGDMSV